MTGERGIHGIVPVEAVPEKVSRHHTFEFTEGPTWDPANGELYFSDLPPWRTYRLAGDGTISVLREGTNRTNGMMLDRDGLLMSCEWMARRVTAVDVRTGEVMKVLAESYQGKPFNQPNDLVMDRKGGIYFTDPIFGGDEPRQDAEAVYYIRPGGEVVRVSAHAAKPNGLTLSGDERLLYVADTMGKFVLRFEVRDDGTLSEAEEWGELQLPSEPLISSALDGTVIPWPGYPDATGADGMAIDTEGRLYVTTKAGVQVLSAEGARLGIIEVPEVPANCTFAGPDLHTLFITARTSLYRIDLSAQGLPFPQPL